MALRLSKSELEALIENCEARQKSYPVEHPQVIKIAEQIAGYREKLKEFEE